MGAVGLLDDGFDCIIGDIGLFGPLDQWGYWIIGAIGLMGQVYPLKALRVVSTVLRLRARREPFHCGLLFRGRFSFSFSAEVRVASPGSGLRSLIANTCDLGCGYCSFGCPKPVIWHAWCLNSSTLGDHRAIPGHLGADERRLWGQGADFYRFGVVVGTPF